MSLGERIYRLRTEKNLSQGDLAEMLEVSRQSISKWENNNAVPDLEKIIKLSEIFGVSLDQLVKGEEAPGRTETVTNVPWEVATVESVTDIPKEAATVESVTDIPWETGNEALGQTVKEAHQQQPKESGFPPRKIAGTILLCMAFLVVMFFLVAGGGLAGCIFALPFLTCGILCFALKKNVGIWCAWDIYVLFDIYMSYATGISRASVLYIYSYHGTPFMNYPRMAFAWFLIISLVVLIAVTVVRLGKGPFDSEQKERSKLIVAWEVLALILVVSRLWVHTNLYKYLIENIVRMAFSYRLISIVLSWAKIIAFTVALVYTSRFIKMKKQK